MVFSLFPTCAFLCVVVKQINIQQARKDDFCFVVPWPDGEFNWRGTLRTTKVKFLLGYINPEGCLSEQGRAC